MPFIDIKTNKKVSDTAFSTVRESLDEIITLFPGKSKAWLMTSLSDSCRMAFCASDESCAMVEVKLFGTARKADCERFASAVTSLLSKTLDIPQERIYVKFEGCELWGFSGQLF